MSYDMRDSDKDENLGRGRSRQLIEMEANPASELAIWEDSNQLEESAEY